MPLLITSPHNLRIKQLLRLRDKRDREREGLMLVEGHAELTLALDSGAQPRALFYCPELIAHDPNDLLTRAPQAEQVEVSRTVFEKIAYRDGPDGWLGMFPLPRRALSELTLPVPPLVVVAEAIEKPGNLGAILRSADAAGVDAVIVCDPTTDTHHPNVVRSSRGTVFTVPVIEAKTDETLVWLRAHRIQIIAATPQATLNYTAADLRGAVALAVGTENEGLSPTWLAMAEVQVRLPMRGRVNSLNVATAATLLMYEAVRQRGLT